MDKLWEKIKYDSFAIEHSMDQLYRKQTGTYYTGLDLAYTIMQEMIHSYPADKKKHIAELKFLEPCVGTGNFVFAYLRCCLEMNLSKETMTHLINNIYACDINKEALYIYKCNMRLVAKEWFGITLDESYFKTHIGRGLIFDVSADRVEYIPIQKVFSKQVVDNGFDVVVTNPPYKNLKAEKGHYSNTCDYDHDKKKYLAIAKISKEIFPNSSSGTLNIYKFFVEEIINRYLNENGVASLLIPASILSDKSCTKLRTRILTECSLNSVRLIEENNKQVDSSQALCTILFHKGKKTERIRVDGSLDGNITKGCLVDVKDIIDENTGNAILVLNNHEYEIYKQMKKNPSIREIGCLHNLRGELDITINRNAVQTERTPYTLYRGRNVGFYQLAESSTREYVSEKFVDTNAKRKYIHKNRLVCQQIVNMAKKKRIAFTVIPKDCVLANSCNFITVDENLYGIDMYFVLGILNSSLIEWFFKLTSSNNHINNYEIDSFPIPIKYKEKEVISELVKEFLETKNDQLLTDIDAQVYRAFGITNSSHSGKVDMKKENTTPHTGEEALEYRFLADLKKIIPSVNLSDCRAILHGEASIRDLGFVKKPEITDFEKRVVEGIETKYKKIYAGEILNHTTFKLSNLDLEMISAVPQGGSWKDIPAETVKKSKRLERITQTGGRTTLYGRIDYSKPAYTITTYFNRPGNGTYVHPIHERVLSVREAARFQCFPDDYLFIGNKSNMLKQVGNAVPAIFAYQIAEKIIKKTRCSRSIDLFSGAGGMTYGFKQAGIEAVIANDFEESACLTLKTNCPDIEVLYGDITVQKTKDKIIEVGLRANADIICGGPPCQGFSMAGFRRKDDPRNLMFKHFVDIVSAVNPKVIVFENVEGLLSYRQGETYKEIMQLFSEVGFLTEGRTLLTSEYGVPQKRRRVIVICTRKDLNIKPGELFPDAVTPVFEKQINAYATIHDLEQIACSDNAKYNSTYTSPLIEYFRGKATIGQYLGVVKKSKPSLW